LPTHSENVFEAFAGIGAIPVSSIAGDAMKLLPPATAFMAPPITPATNKKMALGKFIRVFYDQAEE
jgi:hypothetical protein